MGYYFSTPVTNVQPYIYWSTSYQASAFGINIFLPNLFTGTPTTPVTQGPFTFTTTVGGDAVRVPYKIVVAANSTVWQFSNTPIRAFSSDFVQFMLLLEKQGLQPGGAGLIQQAMSQYLPLTFTETLYYRYRFDPVNGFIDLTPGMRLRLDYEVHQSIDPSPTNYLNGFVGNGTSYLQVSAAPSGATILTGFNPFLSALQRTAVAPNQGGAAGPIDLSGQAFAYPYYRLFYPKNYPSSDSTGSVGVANNPVILGVSSLADLNTATQAYLTNGNFGGVSGASAFFRGRVTITPEVPILLFGQPSYVAVGTTIRQLLSGFTTLPRMTGLGFNPPSQMFYRWMIADYTTGSNPAQWKFPALGDGAFNLISTAAGGYQVYTPVLDSLDLPVIGGDYLSFTIPGN
jgi:hypothetical protein